MSAGKPVNWTLWGAVAALFLLPALIVAFQYKKLLYGLDQGQATISAKDLQKGKAPASRNLTITDAILDVEHTVTWVLLENGSEKERYYLIPLGPKGKKRGPVKVVLTSDSERLDDSGSYTGLLRDIGGDGVSRELIKKLEDQGLEVDAHPLLVQVGASSSGELYSLLFYIGCALVAPISVIGVMLSMGRKEKSDAGREVKIAQLRANVPPDLKQLEDTLRNTLTPYLPRNDDSMFVYSFTLVGPFKVTMHIDDQDHPAPPDVFGLVQAIHECYRKHGVKVEGVHYFMERDDDSSPWRMRAKAS
jgi:hypothetical protein